jgi:hypothetical protein
MKNVFRIMLIAAAATLFALPAYAQDAAAKPAVSAQDAEAKAKLYEQFLAKIKGGAAEQKEASAIGKDYLSKYGTPTDDADKQIIDYIRNWVEKYDKAVRDFELSQSLQSKNYAKTFEIGRAILREQPENLNVLLLLSRAAVSNVSTGGPNDKSLNPEGIRVTRQAIQLLEAGKTPEKWDQFPNRDEALGFLHFAHGLLAKETSPAEAATAFVKAAQTNSTFKSFPGTFLQLAFIYESTELKKLADEYNAAFPAGKEIPEDQKARYDQMLAQIAAVQDRIIDVYARAVVAAGNDPKLANDKKIAMTRMTAY